MNERRALVEAYRQAYARKIKCALATITYVRGSSYRRPGAKMLITEEGDIAGSVSGGCLERDLIQRAKRVLETGVGQLIQYDTSRDGEEGIPSLGLGCEGVIEILLDPDCKPTLEAIERVEENGIPVIVEKNLRTLNEPARVRNQERHPLTDLDLHKSESFLRDGIFYDVLRPRVHWVIFGAGHDAISMTRLSHELGWRVTLVDCRSSFAIPKKFFGHVDEIIQGEPSTIFEKIRVTAESLCVLMTHNYDHDLELLEKLLKSPVNYIGMLGPKTRSEKMLTELENQGVRINLKRLHFPVGLDLGGEGPSSIALAVLAEALAVLNGRNAGFLKNRIGPIHALGSEPGTTISL